MEKATKKLGAAKRAQPAKTAKKVRKTPEPVTFRGEPASNRHYKVSVAAWQSASKRAQKEGFTIAEILRAGLNEYAKGASRAAVKADGAETSLPSAGVKGLKNVYKSGDSDRVSAYMASLSDEGWPLQVIADAVVDAGLAPTLTRQAVSLRIGRVRRINKSGFKDWGLPEIPEVGARRPYPSRKLGGGTRALSKRQPGDRELRTDSREVTVRITDSDYEDVLTRSKFEGAKIAAVCEDILARYGKGSFKMPKIGSDGKKKR